ncbi:MAG: hypothetical protein JST46_04340 [Bacteroidetes bacterium]|nr:hypothetical protein [Bacteroidota bacterium]
MMDLYHTRIVQNENDSRGIKTKIGVIEKHIENVEERFAFGEIDRDVYERIAARMKAERAELEAILGESQIQLSNPEKTISQALEIASNLVNLWDSGTVELKTDLQKLVFPKGVQYDRKNNDYNEVDLLRRSLHCLDISPR